MKNDSFPPWLLAAALAFTSCLGCGLSDYEARMRAEEDRLRYIDEEDRLLADPVEVPPGAEGEAPPVDVFFRPPKGIQRSPETNPNFAPLIRFRSSNTTVPFSEVYLNVSGKSLADFRSDVLRVFPNFDPEKATAYTKNPLDRKPLPYLDWPSIGPSWVSVYSYAYEANQRSPVYVAVIFNQNASNTPNAALIKDIKDYSLASLIVGPNAKEKMNLFRAAAPKPEGKPEIRGAPPRP